MIFKFSTARKTDHHGHEVGWHCKVTSDQGMHAMVTYDDDDGKFVEILPSGPLNIDVLCEMKRRIYEEISLEDFIVQQTVTLINTPDYLANEVKKELSAKLFDRVQSVHSRRKLWLTIHNTPTKTELLT